jgi:O-antigen/teichoic acid export membrane protein
MTRREETAGATGESMRDESDEESMLGRLWDLHSAHRATTGTILTGFALQATFIVSGVLIARILGVENRGNLALLLLFPMVLAQLGGAGLPLAATYYIARERASASAILRRLTLPIVIQASVLVAVHAGLLAVLPLGEADAIRAAGLITLLAVPGALAQVYGLAVLQGLERFRAFNVCRLLQVSLNSAAILAIFVAGLGGLWLVALIWVSSLLAAGGTTMFAAARAAMSGDRTAAGPGLAQMLRFGVKGLLGSVSPIESFRLDQLVVGLLVGPAALGLYVVGMAFTNLPRFIAQSIGMVTYPRVAALSGNADAMWPTLGRFFAVTLMLCGVIVAALEVSAGWLVVFFFGADFAEATVIARILLLAALFFSARRVLADGARGAGHPELGTVAEISSWGVLIPAIAIAAPNWGAEGVAGALVLSSAVSLVVLGGLLFTRVAAARAEADRNQAVLREDAVLANPK